MIFNKQRRNYLFYGYRHQQFSAPIIGYNSFNTPSKIPNLKRMAPKKKLSGAENLKKKAKRELEFKKGANALSKFLQKNEESRNDNSYFSEELLPSSSSEQNNTSLLPSTSSELDKAEHLENMDISIEFQNTELVSNTEPSEPSINSDPVLWPSFLTSKQIDYIVVSGPEILTELSSIQLDHEKRHFSKIYFYRHLPNGEKLVRRWLICSKSTGRIFCFCCKLFDRTPRSSLAIGGFSDWHNISTALTMHEKAPNHFKAYGTWIEIEKRLKLNKTIDAEHQRITNMETDYWVKVLDRLLSVTLFLSKNNLVFRGSSDKFYTQNNGNFLSLVELLGKYDDVTKELLHKTLSREKTVHYCSHSIQNELINLMANKVLETIIDR